MSNKDRGNGGGYILPFLLCAVILGGTCVAATWLDGRSMHANKDAQENRLRIKENQTRVHNLNVQVSERSKAAYIARKCRELNLGLRLSEYNQVSYLVLAKPEVDTTGVDGQPTVAASNSTR